MMFGKKSKEEIEAKAKSRKYIQEVRDIVMVDHEKLETHICDFKHHVTKGEDTVDKIFNMIDEQKCPKEETINILERYRKEQNGHLKTISASILENKEKLNAIINQNSGKEHEKEVRNRKWTLWIAGIGAIAICVGFYFQLSDIKSNKAKDTAVMEYKMKQLEEKINE
jgi:PBP1b-binding outer membrane lipoprotein LpoB